MEASYLASDHSAYGPEPPSWLFERFYISLGLTESFKRHNMHKLLSEILCNLNIKETGLNIVYVIYMAAKAYEEIPQSTFFKSWNNWDHPESEHECSGNDTLLTNLRKFSNCNDLMQGADDDEDKHTSTRPERKCGKNSHVKAQTSLDWLHCTSSKRKNLQQMIWCLSKTAWYSFSNSNGS